MALILENTSRQARWVYYKIAGVPKKILIEPFGRITVNELKYEDQINFSPIDVSIKRQIDRGKNFRSPQDVPDVRVVQSSSACVPTNLLINGDFEAFYSGFGLPYGWAQIDAGLPLLSMDDSTPYEGNQSLILTPNTGDVGRFDYTYYKRIKQEIYLPYENGEQYVLSGALKLGAGADFRTPMSVYINEQPLETRISTDSTEWITSAVTFTPQNGTVQVGTPNLMRQTVVIEGAILLGEGYPSYADALMVYDANEC